MLRSLPLVFEESFIHSFVRSYVHSQTVLNLPVRTDLCARLWGWRAGRAEPLELTVW